MQWVSVLHTAEDACGRDLLLFVGEKRGRVMAEWKPFDLTWGRSIYYCSECEESVDLPTAMGKPLYKYCPNCGERMKGADDGVDDV